MSKKRTLVLLAVMLLVLAPAARSAGFLIYEHGAAAMAMAGAFTSLAKDPSALWHNPAGMAFLDGTQILAGATFIIPSGSVTFDALSATYKQKSQIFYPPNFYLTHRIDKKVVLGLGVTAPYGLGIEWPDPETFPWRYLGTMADMKTFFINPAIAFKLSERLSIGLGVSFIYSKFIQSVTQPMFMDGSPESPPPAGIAAAMALPVLIDIPTDMDAHGTSFAFNAGILYKTEQCSLGLNYRSRFSLGYTGTVTLDASGLGIPDPVPGTVDVTLNFPDIVSLGLSFNLTKKLVWAIDLHYLFWSLYDSYTAHLVVPGLGMIEDIPSTPNWSNSYTARTGFEYQVSNKLALRWGVIYDKTPQPASTMDSTLPDADRLAFTGGFGYKFGKIYVDFAYHHEHFMKRTSARTDIFAALPGTFKMQAHLIGINLGYKF